MPTYLAAVPLPYTQILIVGGTQTGSGSTKVPVAESFDLSNPNALTLNVTMPPTFVRATGSNWYPFVRRLPKGKLLLRYRCWALLAGI